MSGAAQLLQVRLGEISGGLGGTADTADHWADKLAMARTLAQVQRQHGRVNGGSVATDKIARAVAAFRASGRVANFVELKHACLGIGSMAAAGACLLAEDTRREKLLSLAETVPTPRRQIKCFQCLLRAYWSFPLHDDNIGTAVQAGFSALRAWLERRYAELQQTAGRKPSWFATLAVNANLLGPQPCRRYAPALLRGDAAELQHAVDGLAIPGDSWVKEEAVLAQMREAATLADADWLRLLPQLLDIAAGNAGIGVSAALAQRCVALLAARHARCESAVLHEGLLDAALATIGNPWLRRAAWDAHVLEADGRPGEHARAMIDSWAKQRLIADFFKFHGSDPGGRRCAYWQKYDPFVTALWVGLGANAATRADAGLNAFRKRAKGALLFFDEAAGVGAALLLRIGDILALEFGEAGRPLLLYRWDGLEPFLMKRLLADRSKKYFDIAGLLLGRADLRLEHRDDVDGGAQWEDRFDARIRPLVWRYGGG